MEKVQNNKEYYSIDLIHIVKSLWRRVWIIVLSGVLAGVIGFSVAAFGITPKYSSSIMLYVNSSAISMDDFISITPSQLSAAQSLVKTYIVLLKNRTTLEKVIDKADVSYTYEELEDMIDASSVNETEIMRVTVTSEDPYEAAKIVNAIAEVLPRRVSDIIDGSSMEVVDAGTVNLKKVSPSITGFTAIGMLAGIVLSVLVLVLLELLDDTIRDEEYILQNYDYPILAKIPDLLSSDSKPYEYYYHKQSSN
jgi:capsular polysaccharide biosynthesis protein